MGTLRRWPDPLTVACRFGPLRAELTGFRSILGALRSCIIMLQTKKRWSDVHEYVDTHPKSPNQVANLLDQFGWYHGACDDCWSLDGTYELPPTWHLCGILNMYGPGFACERLPSMLIPTLRSACNTAGLMGRMVLRSAPGRCCGTLGMLSLLRLF